MKTILQLYLILRPGNFVARLLRNLLYLSAPALASFYQVP